MVLTCTSNARAAVTGIRPLPIVVGKPTGSITLLHFRKPARAVEMRAVAVGPIHISEEAIVVGSGVVSVLGPLIFSAIRGSK